MELHRRHFLSSIAVCGSLTGHAFGEGVTKKYRVAVVGHTGRGDYGHGLHTMWLGIDRVDPAAVADADPLGLERTLKLFGEAKGFASYRAMLSEVRPDIVAIAMRHIDQHCEVALAAIEAGARGLYIEKPFCRSLEEADAILNAARIGNVKIAVAHRNRYHPVLPILKGLIQDGEIGRVLEYRMRGKEDHRGGSLDLWVLGSHLANLVAYFAGRPKSCSATILIDGRPAAKSDAVPGSEGIGLMAGNEVHARFEMEDGLAAYFDSIAKAGNAAAGFGIQIIGTRGIIDLRIDREPLAHLLRGSPFQPDSNPRAWTPISSAGIGLPEPIADLGRQISMHWTAGRDLIGAVEEDREPLCSGTEAATTIEMISAVAVSHLQDGVRVELPLKQRTNPWG